MKKFSCIVLAFLLCFTLFGCRSKTVRSREYRAVHGEITEIIGNDVLALKLGEDLPRTIEQLGEYVHIVTADANAWCVGDEIEVKYLKYEKFRNLEESTRITAESISAYSACYKPVIYLYPESATNCSVKLNLDGEFTCTYPAYGENGWQNFTAYPDGTLIFPDGMEYYALYWEGMQKGKWDFSEGFCIAGEDTDTFLEWALAEQGLTRREANEFIMYWLPIMQENPYNVISFQTDAYTDGAVLDIEPAPDNLLRVFMAFYPADSAVEIEPQTFGGFTREGFTVVEWGGSQVDAP